MFNTLAHSGIEAFQTGKKYIVDSFYPTKELKQVSHDFIDAQTAYTKSAIDATLKLYAQTGEILLDRTPFVETAKYVQSLFPFAPSASKKAK